jgi:hypothetical protein
LAIIEAVLYRDLDYVEPPAKLLVLRCYCDAPATTDCASCRRPRCAAHVTRELCSRCTEAVERELQRSSGGRWMAAGAAGVALAVAMLCLHAVTLPLTGLPMALVTGALLRRKKRAQVIRELRPMLATTIGELPSPPRDEAFPEPTQRGLHDIPPA